MRALAILLILFAAAPALAEDDLSDVAGIAGVPLMPGLTELEDERTVFDKPEGRIVDAVAVGAVPAEAVIDFYTGVLEAFGWTPVVPDVADGLIVVRGAEVLHIRLRDSDDGLRIHFSLAPYQPPE